jgi:hypothetical protein
MKIRYLATILIGIAGLCPSARAVNTYLGGNTYGGNEYTAHYTSPSDTYLVGTVIPGIQGNQGQVNRDVAMTNFLLNNPGQTTNNGSLYSSTGLSGPQATTAGAVTNGDLGISFPNGYSGPVTIDLSQVGTFTYLVVAYDGPNSGVAVWNIAGLTGTIQFNSYARPDGTTGNLLGSNLPSQYKITSFTLLNPTGGVPDGGATVMLLGAALGALGMVRRYLAS